MPAIFWISLAFAFLLAFAIAHGVARAFDRRFGSWTRVRRARLAAVILPLLLLILILACIVWAQLALPDEGEGNRDMTTFYILFFCGPFVVITFLGGVLGAGIAATGKRR
jgi:Na+/proline symporter